MDGFGGLGLNPAGVSLFRMHVERCPSGPLSSMQARWKLLVHGRPPPGFPWFFLSNFAAACQVNVILTISTLPVRYCLAVALAFLHPSLGPQKATLGSFSMDGFGGLGLNPAGVSLFRMHVERCLSGLLRSIQARRKLLVHGRPPPGFPWFFLSNFAAAC